MNVFETYLSERAVEGGFIRECDLEGIIQNDRLRVLLVRCGAKRFMAPAQDVASMVAAVEASGDYVRDVSFPASDPIFRGDYSWRATTSLRGREDCAETSRHDRPTRHSSVYTGNCSVGEPSDADPGL